jgi:polar amino acid transport system permease protein
MNHGLWNWEFAAHVLPELLKGLAATLHISVVSGTIAVALGVAWAVLLELRMPVVSHAVRGLIELVRGTPLLVQLYVAFYVLPMYGIMASAEVTGIAGLALYFSGYMTAVIQAGIRSVPPGQWEAARAIGFTPARTWWTVVLPQALRKVLPPIGSYLLLVLKESSMLSAITVSDLLHAANTIGSDNFRYVEPLTIAALIYFAISYPFARVLRVLESRLDVNR